MECVFLEKSKGATEGCEDGLAFMEGLGCSLSQFMSDDGSPFSVRGLSIVRDRTSPLTKQQREEFPLESAVLKHSFRPSWMWDSQDATGSILQLGFLFILISFPARQVPLV
jgi:hypothetical protein